MRCITGNYTAKFWILSVSFDEPCSAGAHTQAVSLSVYDFTCPHSLEWANVLRSHRKVHSSRALAIYSCFTPLILSCGDLGACAICVIAQYIPHRTALHVHVNHFRYNSGPSSNGENTASIKSGSFFMRCKYVTQRL